VDTKTGDLFFDDLMTEGHRQFGLRKPSDLALRVYFTQLVVEFEADISALLSKSKALYGLLGAHLKKLCAITTPASLHTLTLKPDPERLPPRLAGGLLADFSLQRRVFAPYESNRFYSTAPLPTEDHIEFLKRLEELAL
jgi:hypothetical protein